MSHLRIPRLARGAPGATAAAIVAACAAPPPAVEAHIEAPPPASPGAAASADMSSSAAPVAGAAAKPPRIAPRTSTPSKIACETTECDLATEVCCVVRRYDDDSTTGTCVPRAADRYPSPCCAPRGACSPDGVTTDRACDETADCPAGQQCGHLDRGEGDLELQYCDARRPVEVCLAGSTCENGNDCEAEASATLGTCNLQIAPPRCGSRTCKVGETCCWNVAEKRGGCATTCADDEMHLACTSPEQCDHSDCDSYPGSPRYDCGGGSFQMGVLCRTVKDCPQQLSGLGIYPGGPTLRGCKHVGRTPPRVKECVYE
jgi:hypothetical protein